MDFNRIQHIFFLGIGGIGMSAMARYFHDRGVHVSGYDKTPSPITQGLAEEGIRIGFEDDPLAMPASTQLCIYTPAIPATNRLLNHCGALGIPLVKRAEVLGQLSRQIPCIAVAGTHGKTSICAMLAHILKTAGIPAEALLGGISANYNTNYLGDKQARWLIAEADEYDRSFLHLQPELAVITSIDPDHLDVYGNKESLEGSFSAFARKVRPEGSLLVKEGIQEQGIRHSRLQTYGTGPDADYRADNIRIREGRYCADFGGLLQMAKVEIGIPGRHNVENALAAAAIAHQAGADPEHIRTALGSCLGVKRRFETIYRSSATIYIDDYAHHPRELAACIQTARELFPGKKITGVFQPHLYSRTRDMAPEFAESLGMLDEAILLEIYPAREEAMQGVHAGIILEGIPSKNKLLTTREDLLEVLQHRDLEVLITMGAGDIDRMVGPIKEMLIRRKNL
jgi:UDP-N-acetylmuramate--alanine ligase